ncbi:hypothetical protein [Paractinoplanes lichenicola]|uniref:Uncharacterized protein n=1 Tax=Paractinoplanes lichenicola TaxID=2802976 RepID=A0ABS1W2D0_9ACTN|nr:hypothetical protein [Actinoplanes lichenicola]MBL7260891.1 hypothetical protein [Actinoplanes lichenicola]
MRSDMGELLDEAAQGAPPLRHDADSVLRAGRGRKRRRNAGWAIAAVVAVTAAIGVPQLVRREQAHPVTPAPVPTVVTTPARGAVIPFVTRSQSFEAAGYRVENPEFADVRASVAWITPVGWERPAGWPGLTIYGPGVDPLARFPAPGATIIEVAPINGRRAFWLKPDPRSESRDEPMFFWEYADGLLARLEPSPNRTEKADLPRIAEAFRLAPEQALTVPFRVGYVPAAWSLTEASSSASYRGVRFEHVKRTSLRMKTPDRVYDRPNMDKTPSDALIALEPVPAGTDPDPAKVTCGPHECHRVVADGRYLLRAGGISLSEAEHRRMLESVTMADPDDRATWTSVNEAVPEANQLRVP